MLGPRDDHEILMCAGEDPGVSPTPHATSGSISRLRSTPDPERKAELGSGTAEVLSLHLCGVVTFRDLSLLVVTQPLV